eukprot:scpid25615/ scgid4849/ LINE-1 reverse transcriptase homolog
MILGDLNAKVGSARPASGGAVGCFSKHVSSNANGERLIELYRMQHRSTWFSDGLVHRDGQPVRNMIDFVIMRRSNTVRVVNARSYGGFTTRSDHHPVIADFRLTFWRCTTSKATNDRCFIKYNEPTQDSAESFKNAIASTLPDINTPPEDISTLDQTWERFVSSTHAAAEKAFGRKKPQKRIARSTSPAVIELSTQQKEIHSRIHMEKDPNKRKELTQSRNKILHRIRALLRNEGDLYWQHKAEAVDALRPDARSYFNAIKQLKALRNPDKPSPVRLANDSGENVTNVNWNLEEFSKYFASVFYRSDQPTLFPAQPNSKAKDEPFTSEEIRKAIMHQKIGGAVGCDGISAALLRTASTVITPWLTTLFNSIKELHYCPPDLRCGLLVPVYKRGKPMGAPKSYRPVMLLSVVRKVLTRIITMRSQQSTTSYVRESQAGFTPGRSTADGVFYTRVMCERALLGDWKYSAALLDFSGAFDTIVREKALARFSDSGAATDVVATLISDTTVRVKLSSHLGKAFATNIGVVQGDPLSPIMYNVYAEGAMRHLDPILSHLSLPAPTTQYADDTTIHDTERREVEEIVEKSSEKFKEDNLMLNIQKTQYITVTKADSSWRSVKLLGSLLGSAEDIQARIGAANRAFGSISWKRHKLSSRLCMFSALILPILLYNCGLWALTQQLSNRLDAWHRRKLRYLLGVVYPHHMSNAKVYASTRQGPVGTTCRVRRRRLLWLGHVVREGRNSASYQALEMAINTRDIKRPRGQPHLRWIDNIKK